ncbi:MAG: WD40 repeat domain-containing serine/threonine protein kinase [Pirellulales bacterium]
MVNSSFGNNSELSTSTETSSKSASKDESTALEKLSFIDRLLIQNLPERFSVLATLGRGTYGNVYLALDQRLRREVAIKVLRPEWMTVENAKNRFLRESRAAARLNHSSIVRVIEADENSKIAWQVADVIRGQSLAAVLRKGPLEPATAAKLVSDLAYAVHCAHEHGVVHRDIKPENVLLQLDDDEAKQIDSLKESVDNRWLQPFKNILDPSEVKVFLTDFGLAKIQDEGIDQSGSTTLLGTPRYMAPEQFDLTGSRSLPSADIFALGAILFECLTGQSAFEGASSLAQRVALGLTHHPSPRVLWPSLSKDLDIICRKALHPSASKRYSTAAELADDLDCYLRGQPIKARPQSAMEKFCRLVSEHQSLAIITAAVIVCLAVISVVSWQSQREMQVQNLILERVNRELANAKERVEKSLEEATKLRLQAETERQIFSETVWLAGIREAYRHWEASRLWETKQALSELAVSHTNTSVRLDWRLLANDLNHHFRSLFKLDKSIEEVRTVPGTNKVAFASSNGHLYLYDLSCGRIVADLASELPSLNALAVHPTKPCLYFGGVTYPNRHIASIYQHELTTGITTEIITGFETTIESIEVTDDGKSLLCASRYQNVRLYDLDTLTYREFPADRRNLWLAQTSSPKKLVFQKEQTVLSIEDPVEIASDEIVFPRGIQFCEGVPGTSLVAVSFGSSEYFNLIDVQSKQAVAQLRGEAINNIRCVHCSDNGRLLFCATESGAVLAWELKIQERLSTSKGTLNSTSDQIPVLDPVGSWHLADSPILSICLANDRLVCGTQNGDLLDLNVANIARTSESGPIETPLGNSVAVETLRELEVRLDSTCQFACIRTMSGKVVIRDLANQRQLEGSANSLPTIDTPNFAAVQQLPLLPFNPNKIFVAENNVGGLCTGCSSSFAFLRDSSTLQIFREGKVVDVPTEIDSSDNLQVLGVESNCQSIAISASRDIYIVDIRGSSSCVRKVASMEGSPWTVAWHPSGKKIVVGGDFPQLREIDLETLQVTVASNTPTMSNLVAYVNDGNAILSAHTEGTIRYSDLSTGSIQSISAHKSVIRSFTLSHDGSVGLSIDDESNIAVWKLPQLEKIGFLMKGRSCYERDAFVRPTIRLAENDQRLVTIFNDNQQPVIQFRKLD